MCIRSDINYKNSKMCPPRQDQSLSTAVNVYCLARDCIPKRESQTENRMDKKK